MDGEKRGKSGRRRGELLRYLRKLAKCRNNDVMKLAFLEPEDRDMLDELDLTGVAELRRGANGTLEVKFVDRMKVLAMLRELLDEDGGSVEELLGGTGTARRNERPAVFAQTAAGAALVAGRAV